MVNRLAQSGQDMSATVAEGGETERDRSDLAVAVAPTLLEQENVSTETADFRVFGQREGGPSTSYSRGSERSTEDDETVHEHQDLQSSGDPGRMRSTTGSDDDYDNGVQNAGVDIHHHSIVSARNCGEAFCNHG